MTYVVTYIEVQPSAASQASALLEQYRKTSSAEEGCSGIAVLGEISRQNRFVIIEIWNGESLFHVHENAEPTSRFRSELNAIHKSPYDQRVHHDFAVGPHAAATGANRLFVVTHIDVPPPRKDETEVLLRSTAEQIRQDEGNLRYDVFQQNMPRTNHFTVVAIWNDGEAFTLHEEKPHTRQFREALGPMLGAPYDERLYKHLD